MPKFIMMEDGDYVNSDFIVGLAIRKLPGDKKHVSVEDPNPQDTWEVLAFVSAWNGWYTLFADGKEIFSKERAQVLLTNLKQYLET